MRTFRLAGEIPNGHKLYACRNMKPDWFENEYPLYCSEAVHLRNEV